MNMRMMNKFDQVKEILHAVEVDVVAFYEKGNKAAGARVNRAMKGVKVLAQEIRAEVLQKRIAKNNQG